LFLTIKASTQTAFPTWVIIGRTYVGILTQCLATLVQDWDVLHANVDSTKAGRPPLSARLIMWQHRHANNMLPMLPFFAKRGPIWKCYLGR